MKKGSGAWWGRALAATGATAMGREKGGMDEHDAPPAAPSDVDDTALPFDALFARYHGPIYAYLLGMVGDVAAAQTLTENTFLTAYQALACEPDPVLPAWLYRIATTAAFAALRRRCRWAWLPFAPGDERCPAPVCALPTICGEHEAVWMALAQLSPHERACLLLGARAGLTLAEIAAALGASEVNATVLLYRAKERFRRVYRDREVRRCR